MNKVFTFDAPAFEITKSYRNDNGQMFIEGIASTTAIDLTGERMSPEVIAKMAARLVGKPLRDEHQKGWYDKMGEIIQADVVDHAGKPALWIKAKLYDWSTKAKDLFGMLKAEGVKMGLSVAGKINPGGLVKELVDSAGKYIPTYKDIEPTEVSITDHPANLDTFALAVTKSLNIDQYDPNEYAKEAEVKKDEECADCEATLCEHGKCMNKEALCKDMCDKCLTVNKGDEVVDFLDLDNQRWPADEKHLLPALRYFNQDGQREAQKYDEVKWNSMGEKLSAKLSKVAGEKYLYDSSKEKIIRGESSKEKEVNNMNKGNLVSKNIPEDVKSLAKEWGKDIDGEMKKAAGTEGADVKKGSSSDSGSETPSSFSVPTLGGSGSSSGSSDSSSSSGSTSSGSSGGSSDIAALLSDLKSTLSAIQSSLSGSDSTSSGSGSSDSSSGSSSSGSDKTSTDKAVDDSTSSASSTASDDEMARAIDSLVQAANTMREIAQKAKAKTAPGAPKGAASDYHSSENSDGGSTATSVEVGKGANGDQHAKIVAGNGKPALADQDKEPASDEAASANSAEGGNSTSYGGVTAKALGEVVSLVKEMQKSLAKRDEEFTKLVEKREETPVARKGVALTVEKNFTGHQEVQSPAGDDEMLKTLQNDKEITFREYHLYRDYGVLPKKYQKSEKK